jgi:hypothetical protein
MFIEDHLLRIAGYGTWVYNKVQISLGINDDAVIASMADTLVGNSAFGLTEKQGNLLMKIFNKHIKKIQDAYPHLVSEIAQDFANPIWKHPFRVIPQHKTISIGAHPKYTPAIFLEFPFDSALVEYLRSWNRGKPSQGMWDNTIRKWVFALREENILMVGDELIPKGFVAPEEFIQLYKNADHIRSIIDQHLPMLTDNSGQLQFVNAHKNIPQLATTNLIDALYTARNYGITVWSDTIEEIINNDQFNITTRSILKDLNADRYLWLNSNDIEIETFNEVLTYGGPALIIVPGGSELENIKKWTAFILNLGILKSQIAVMFRLPNSESEFNNYVKEIGINNLVDDSTRVVFVSTKIPKPLIKQGITFPTVINLGFYNTMHFTMSTIIDNARNLVYYSIKEPSKVYRAWQQQR